MAGVNQIRLPSSVLRPNNLFSPVNNTMSASTSKMAWVFVAEASDTITALGYRYGARALTPPSYKISLQGVDGSGFPDGTVKGGASPASHVFTPPADTSIDGTLIWQTLDNAFTLTAGTLYSIVIEYSAGTINGTNNSSFTYRGNNSLGFREGLPYALLNVGSWVSQGISGDPVVFGYKSAARSYGNVWVTSSNDACGGIGKRLALKFNLVDPESSGSTFQIRGITMWTSTPSAASNWKFGVWNGAGTVQASVSLDADATGNPGASADVYPVTVWFTSLVTLNYGTTYYAGIEQVDNAVGATEFSVTSAADFSSWPGGSGWCSSAWNGSAWTDTTTKRPLVDLIFADQTSPAGGGISKLAGQGGGLAA